MSTYNEAHNMPIYQIVYNKFNSSIFASCSGDWRIKIWEDDRMLISIITYNYLTFYFFLIFIIVINFL